MTNDADTTPLSPSGSPPTTATSIDDKERLARMALCAISDPANPKLCDLVAAFGAVEVWRCLREGDSEAAVARRARSLDLAEVGEATTASGTRFLIPGDDEWPQGVQALGWCSVGEWRGAPFGLWAAGPARLDAMTRSAVAVVGARAATNYGEHAAADFAAGLAEKGITIVSGGAYGIDAAAHRGSLAVAGPTIAVLAGGLGSYYPVGNTHLFERIRETGLLVSEQPPTRPPSRVRFLTRNRLIAALSGATLVVEGSSRSGASNTARWCGAVGRPILAVPGPITSTLSATPHRLIRCGEATLVASVDDVLEAIAPLNAEELPAASEHVDPQEELTTTEHDVAEALPARGSVTPGDLVALTGLTPLKVGAALVGLAEKGLIVEAKPGAWKRRRGTGERKSHG
ncbi:MAG: DNA-processing protein DprA [Propionibacteriaceae bacterium]|jgi:DNA processing protein|nr:DNA-processing protein DprA [Propionibacteriaceae bacterium]